MVVMLNLSVPWSLASNFGWESNIVMTADKYTSVFAQSEAPKYVSAFL